MTDLRFDHFISFVDAPSVEAQLDRQRRLGFDVSPGTVRHEPGLRNGFLRFGPEYLEFAWVEDETAFAAAGAALQDARAARRPYSILFHTADPQALHDDRRARGYDLPAVVHKARVDDPAGSPVWSFQPLVQLLSGVEASTITYHRVNPERLTVRVHPNGLYAVQGALFVTADPQARAEGWRDFLAPSALIALPGTAAQFELGPHTATWLTPEAAGALFGRPWVPAPQAGEVAALHLLATGLAHVRTTFEGQGRTVRDLHDDELGLRGLFIEADPQDGFAFVVTQRSVHEWLEWRRARTREALTLDAPPPSAE